MNPAVIPAVVAAGGGGALAGSIYLFERRRMETMRASRESFALRFPLNVDPLAATKALSAMSGLAEPVELVAETIASAESITHRLLIPKNVTETVSAALRSALPGVRLTQTEELTGLAARSVKVFFPTPTILRTSDPDSAARTLLAGLVGLEEGEHVIVRWSFLPTSAPRRDEEPADKSQVGIWRAWLHKRQEPGFSVAGLILVKAASGARARVLAEHVTAVIRSRRNLGPQARFTWERGGRSLASLPRTTGSSGWLAAGELLPLLGWPLGSEVIPGVDVGAARELPAGREVPREGRRLFLGRSPNGSERPVALSPEAARHHVAILGPSGVGKSALMARGILDDIAQGFGGGVIDPKADLVQTVLERIPPEQAERIVLLDPAARARVAGLSVMSVGDAELRTDVIIGALRQMFAGSWGIRSEIWLRLGVRSISEVPGATLADLPRLYFEPQYRRAAVSRLRDPWLIGQWQQFESLSTGEQAQYVASPMAKISALISRPSVRAVLASPDPKIDVPKLLAAGKWLMVPLSPGLLGEGATLIGAVTLYTIWSAIEARAALPEGRRRPVFLHIDELASLATLPFGFEALAERSRGLGAGLTVAAQNLGRLPESVRAALLGNVGSLISFRAGADEAHRLAKELPGLTAADLQALGRFEVAARVGGGLGSSVSVLTGRTQPLPEVTGQAERIRRLSSERYGAEALPPADPPRQAAPEPSHGRTRRSS